MPNFTSIRVTITPKDSLRAMVSLKVSDCMFVTGIRVISGTKGLFVSMPSKKDTAGEYRDICFPASKEFRQELEKAVLDEYHVQLAKAGQTPAIEAMPDSDVPF